MFFIKFNSKIFFFLSIILFYTTAFAQEPTNWQIGFQKPCTQIMYEIEKIFYLILGILSAIFVLVLFLLTYVSIRFHKSKNPIASTFKDNIKLEITWTVIPVILLLIIAWPSFKLIKMVNTIPESDFTIKVVAYQWYWHYEYPDHGNIKFDSYLLGDNELKEGQQRLLEVNKRMVIPENSKVRLIITSADVIHSFAIPSAGIKIDAIPGKVNETWLQISEPGVYYGQCSELCGLNHGFMPIAVEVVSKENFEKWLTDNK